MKEVHAHETEKKQGNTDIFGNIGGIAVHRLVAAVFYLVRNNIFTRINSYLSNNEKTFIRIRNICLIIIGISGAAWVLLTQSNAGADQYYVLDAARGLRNGDYSAFRYNGYIAKYTNQIGLLFI